jgi:hypothetical protein
MKKLLFTILAIVFNFVCFAQFSILGKSTGFDEPEEGYAKVLILKNKHTAYIHITPSDGILIKFYDESYKQLRSRNVEHKFGKLKGMSVEACFEINSDIVLMISEYDGRIPILYRIVLNGDTGQIVSQEEIARLKKITMSQGYASKFGGVPLPDFIVRKDPLSDNYVVALFNSFESERDQRVELMHFNNQHGIISKSYLSTPEDKYKYVNILDVAVDGSSVAYALVYGFNTSRSGGKEGELLLAKFKENKENVEYTSIEIEDGISTTDGILKYNPTTKNLHLITQVQLRKQSNALDYFFMYSGKEMFSVNHYILNPTTNELKNLSSVNLEDVDKKFKELFNKKEGYSGVLQNFYINDDGGYTFLFEGLFITVTTTTGGTSSRTSTTYELGDIAVINFDVNNQMKSTALIPKGQILNNSIMTGGAGVTASPLYHYKRDYSAQWLKGGNQFKSFAYLNGKKKNYILLNDVENNDELMHQGKLRTIMGLGECDAFSFETNSGNILPSRKFVFGKPSGKKDHNLAIFTVSDYDRDRNIYATLKLEIDGRDRKVKLVWMQSE